jgi:hypothetical protein
MILLLERNEKLLLLKCASFILKFIIIEYVIVDRFESSDFVEKVFQDSIGQGIGLFFIDVNLFIHFSDKVLERDTLVEE